MVYVVYRTAVDEWSGHMFDSFSSRTPPSLYLLGWMCPSHPYRFLIVKVQQYGDREDPTCVTIELWVDLPCVAGAKEIRCMP